MLRVFGGFTDVAYHSTGVTVVTNMSPVSPACNASPTRIPPNELAYVLAIAVTSCWRGFTTMISLSYEVRACILCTRHSAGVKLGSSLEHHACRFRNHDATRCRFSKSS
eukprot:4195862-Amphidinium_carterae.1